MKDSTVLNLILEIHQDGILDKLCLQEAFLVNRTIEESLVAEIPEKVRREILHKEML